MHAGMAIICSRYGVASLVCGAAEDGEEAFNAQMVMSAAQTIRQLCIDKPDEGKVTHPAPLLLACKLA